MMIINLFPWRDEIKRKKMRLLWWQFLAIVSLSIFSSAIFYTIMLKALSMQKKEIRSLEKIMNTQHHQSDRDFIENITSGEWIKKINTLEEKTKANKDFLEILYFLGKESPNTMYLNKIVKKEQTIHLYGRAVSQMEVISLVKVLGGKFPDKKISMDEINRINDQDYKIDFTLTFIS